MVSQPLLASDFHIFILLSPTMLQGCKEMTWLQICPVTMSPNGQKYLAFSPYFEDVDAQRPKFV